MLCISHTCMSHLRKKLFSKNVHTVSTSFMLARTVHTQCLLCPQLLALVPHLLYVNIESLMLLIINDPYL